MRNQKIIIIVGPTASGKSEMAVKLAQKLNGEIISADSRQIYKGLDTGSGKVPLRNFRYKNIRHHCIDIAEPKKIISAAQFQRLAKKAVNDIIKRKKLPIICGGTAHWIDAVVYDQRFPKVKPNLKLRAQLKKKSTSQLFKQLQKLDPDRAKDIDRHNPRRLIRALEIVLTTGKAVPKLEQKSKYDAVWIGIKPDQKTLHKNIHKRLKEWLDQGLLKEIENLHNQGLSWQRIEEFGLDYKYGAQYLQNKIDYTEMTKQSSLSIKHYAKRQMTWWKRNQDIKWIKKPKATVLV